ncbi:hypothetical protein LCGC14_2467640, partial [marine sediment metagenome]
NNGILGLLGAVSTTDFDATVLYEHL